MTTDYKITLSPVDPVQARGEARAVLEKAREARGFVPNMYAVMANFPGLLDTYLHGYEMFRSHAWREE